MIKKLLSLLAISLFLVTSFSCSSKESESTTLRTESLLYRVPKDAGLLMVYDGQHPELVKYFKTKEFQTYMKAVMQMAEKKADASATDTEEDKKVKGAIKIFTKVFTAMGLVPSEDGTPPPVGRSVTFLQPGAGFGQYLKTADGKKGSEILAGIVKVLDEEKVPYAKLSGAGYAGVTLDPFVDSKATPEEIAKMKSVGIEAVHIAASDSMVVLATTKALVDRGFTEPTTKELPTVLSSAEFIDTLKAAGSEPNNSRDVGFIYVDGNKTLSQLSTILGKEELKVDDKDAKIWFGGSYYVDGGIIFSSAIKYQVDQEKQALLANVLKSATGSSVNSLPADSAIAISVDAGLVKAVLANSPESIPAEFQGFVEKIKALSVGVSAPGGGSTFPGAAIVVGSDKGGELKDFVKQMVAMSAPGMNFMAQTVDGVAVDNMPTPFGLGVSLAANDKGLFIATQPKAAAAMVSGSSTLGGKSFVANAVKRNTGASAITLYFNYPLFKSLIEGSINSLQMFAPGMASQSGFDVNSMSYMDSAGHAFVSAGIDPNFVRIKMEQSFDVK